MDEPQRISTTHGPRLDDELKRETSALEGGGSDPHVEEGLGTESAVDDELRPDLADASGLTRDPVLARRELSRHLRLGVFPARRDELLAEAEENDAPPSVLRLLAGLPEGARYGTVYEIWDAAGGELEPGVHELLEDRDDDEQSRRRS